MAYARFAELLPLRAELTDAALQNAELPPAFAGCEGAAVLWPLVVQGLKNDQAQAPERVRKVGMMDLGCLDNIWMVLVGLIDLGCVDGVIDRTGRYDGSGLRGYVIDRTGTYDGSGLRVGMIDRACERSHEARRCQPRPLHLRPLRLLAVTAWVGRMDLTCG